MRNVCGRRDMHRGLCWGEKLNARDHMETTSVGRTIILKRILKKEV
jgi:hypothetical protein